MNTLFKLFTFTLILSSTFFMTACSNYKMDVQQGNAISNKEVQQLQRGMSKAEVASLIGNPLLQDNFRKNRWDYVYFTGKGGVPKKIQNLTLQFKDERLIKVSH